MAKRKGPNKSQAIREMIAKGVKKPADIVAALAKMKIKVSPAHISNVKRDWKLGRRVNGRNLPRANGHLNMAALLDAKKLVVAAGSVEAAKKALAALSKLAE